MSGASEPSRAAGRASISRRETKLAHPSVRQCSLTACPLDPASRLIATTKYLALSDRSRTASSSPSARAGTSPADSGQRRERLQAAHPAWPGYGQPPSGGGCRPTSRPVAAQPRVVRQRAAACRPRPASTVPHPPTSLVADSSKRPRLRRAPHRVAFGAFVPGPSRPERALTAAICRARAGPTWPRRPVLHHPALGLAVASQHAACISNAASDREAWLWSPWRSWLRRLSESGLTRRSTRYARQALSAKAPRRSERRRPNVLRASNFTAFPGLVDDRDPHGASEVANHRLDAWQQHKRRLVVIACVSS